MYTLVFDTTAGGTGIGLYKDDKAVYKSEKIMEFGQAEALACGVDEACKTEGIAFSEIGFLGVCSGPGSFTGVRAGLAFARGLCLGHPKLVATGVSAFEVYANMLKEKAFYNAVVIETKREDFYFQLFDKELNKLTGPLALHREEIVEKLKGHQVSFIGDGVERLFSVSLGLQIKHIELSSVMSVEALYQAAMKKYFSKNLDFPKPLYIREADTCVK